MRSPLLSELTASQLVVILYWLTQEAQPDSTSYKYVMDIYLIITCNVHCTFVIHGDGTSKGSYFKKSGFFSFPNANHFIKYMSERIYLNMHNLHLNLNFLK